MKIRVIQENNIVIVTLLDLSPNVISKFKKGRAVVLSKLSDNYLDVDLYSKKYNEGIAISSYSMHVGINSIGSSALYQFSNTESTDRFIKKIKNSINLINHGTEVEIANNLSTYRDTLVEIFQ